MYNIFSAAIATSENVLNFGSFFLIIEIGHVTTPYRNDCRKYKTRNSLSLFVIL